jgi:hypothetical protein
MYNMMLKYNISESNSRGPYTVNHVAQHCVLCNMIDLVWC